MVGKKGFIRIVEAIIAIIIVFGFIVIAIPKGEDNKSDVPDRIKQVQTSVITEISNNATYRKCILNLSDEPNVCVPELVGETVNKELTMGFSYTITNQTDEILFKGANPPLDKNVYGKEVIVSVDDVLTSNPEINNDKKYYKFSLYLWYTI